ncbi:GNAT family N-acetyltransferase [Granulicella sp. L60]|uniref:GNAT family N-acetyltransferase n=1 Tax=Granulicella sp. L60 TaxID=1641866 RepID=UPI00131D00F0|nr:GNAT family N-acetyltransferase [Granulicella sp. L60]
MSLPSNDAELFESLHQFVTTWKLLGKGFPHADQSDRPGLAVSWPDTSFPFYNILFLNEPVSDAEVLKSKAQEASDYLQGKSHGGLFVVFHDYLSGSAKENFTETLAEAKLVAAIPATGMAGNIFPLEAKGHPDLQFVRIEDDATIQTFAELNCAAYNLPMETAVSVVKDHSLWKDHAYGFLAYEGDKAVGTATAIINEGCLFLFLVATLPEAQGKGYGEAVVRYALQTAHEATGLQRTVLHATEAGYPIYARLGYHPTTKLFLCMLQP